MMKTRVVRGGGVKGAPWEAPALGIGQTVSGGKLDDFTTSAVPESAADPHERDAGFAKGHEEGLQAAREEMSSQLGLLAGLIRTFQYPMADLDEQVDEALAGLALTIAQQVLRRELATDPQQIVAVVREARATLRDVQGGLRVAVNPEEAQAVRDMFSDVEGLSDVQVAEDPSITRGGCVVSTDVSRVDARIETRVAQIAAQLLGDARGQEPST